ncbi:hypothetical protein A2641_02230 [Candidatus Nomurabacteria bacterium RIFCSPHIGHO2_01_FULL_37_25]|uniref:VanZ-like domain-containing protein n=1 Tax=Candidatus Nomurabacteria bacterium RIFCSPLOWO2_01_FULL_36_16 TaxID=1801767 RepID=A0A1F6WXX5_9BACT|nr:MAG: hypothetical protein A2641_02230 [Candidatus Nomurabacteria bacterium RIFCSPHIGHO2_01_FULL_37_25]OGI75807.1 MAG: hypothetical protein A3D36_00390 [Candidatus Nomurabacteria bacterium RIFCSPHIGHO2_02_FULL_36_29]OGI86747.1 MAG: hypothetical protein A3A91_01945 [Candidatus Nomurabacteria bacterium RIFCSPLOWO2_01_FULL_36_16]
MDRRKLIKTLIYLIFLIFLVNFFANKFYWYSSIWYFDMIMHFLGGFWVGLAYFYIFLLQNMSSRLIFKILFSVLIIGVGWEVYEILVNDILAQNPFNYIDTVSDLFFDLFGGLCAILYLWIPLEIKKFNIK